MTKPTSKPKLHRGAVLQVRVTEEEKALIEERAEKLSVTVSAYIRYLVLSDCRNAKED